MRGNYRDIASHGRNGAGPETALPRLAGHRAGTTVRKCVRTSARIGIEYLTLYTFSLENWSRPKAEVAGLMLFLEEVLRRETLELDENGVQLNAIGRLDMLPPATREALDRSIEKLSKNRGRADAGPELRRSRRRSRRARRLCGRCRGEIARRQIDDAQFHDRLYDPKLPDPDLLVRTSGSRASPTPSCGRQIACGDGHRRVVLTSPRCTSSKASRLSAAPLRPPL
jgi:undecaprenyl diphosphate synthase